MVNISIDLKLSLDKVLNALAQSLDITKTQHENLVKSYGAVGKFLNENPVFAPYHPVISPQGSLRLGTIIQPVCEDDDLDVDLVYRLTEKHPSWTQFDIKRYVGLRLKEHKTYKDMIDDEGRRCWTLLYRQEADNVKERYHMDILPCVADNGYAERMRQMLSAGFSVNEIDRIAIRITDNKSTDYHTSKNKATWLKSNPDGYAIWFVSRCKMVGEVREVTMSSIMPIGEYVPNKTILQRIVQLLKRHRDIMFNGDENKPISIIITTLAARAYNGEDNLFDGFMNVIERMECYIKKKDDGSYWVENPVNPKENFADKWATHPQRKENFFKWLRKLKQDKEAFVSQKATRLCENFSNAFGQDVCRRVFANIAQSHKEDATKGKLKVASTGLIGSIGQTLNASNTFYGEE